MTADDTTPARVAAAARVRAYLDALDGFYSDDDPPAEVIDYADGGSDSPTLNLCDLRALAALDAQPGDAEQAGGLTDDETDMLRQALRRWLPVSYEGGVKYLVVAVERILAARAAGGPDDDAAERALDEWAFWLGDMDESRNIFDITDEATTVITIDVDTLAQRIVYRLSSEVRAAADTGHQKGDTQ